MVKTLKCDNPDYLEDHLFELADHTTLYPETDSINLIFAENFSFTIFLLKNLLLGISQVL